MARVLTHVEILKAHRRKLISQKENMIEHFCTMDLLCNNNNGMKKRLCLICNETLAAKSMKHSKLKNINTKHMMFP